LPERLDHEGDREQPSTGNLHAWLARPRAHRVARKWKTVTAKTGLGAEISFGAIMEMNEDPDASTIHIDDFSFSFLDQTAGNEARQQ
jgi:hypothetical protein